MDIKTYIDMGLASFLRIAFTLLCTGVSSVWAGELYEKNGIAVRAGFGVADWNWGESNQDDLSNFSGFGAQLTFYYQRSSGLDFYGQAQSYSEFCILGCVTPNPAVELFSVGVADQFTAKFAYAGWNAGVAYAMQSGPGSIVLNQNEGWFGSSEYNRVERNAFGVSIGGAAGLRLWRLSLGLRVDITVLSQDQDERDYAFSATAFELGFRF